VPVCHRAMAHLGHGAGQVPEAKLTGRDQRGGKRPGGQPGGTKNPFLRGIVYCGRTVHGCGAIHSRYGPVHDGLQRPDGERLLLAEMISRRALTSGRVISFRLAGRAALEEGTGQSVQLAGARIQRPEGFQPQRHHGGHGSSRLSRLVASIRVGE
jgi:hypothetical protein